MKIKDKLQFKKTRQLIYMYIDNEIEYALHLGNYTALLCLLVNKQKLLIINFIHGSQNRRVPLFIRLERRRCVSAGLGVTTDGGGRTGSGVNWGGKVGGGRTGGGTGGGGRTGSGMTGDGMTGGVMTGDGVTGIPLRLGHTRCHSRYVVCSGSTSPSGSLSGSSCGQSLSFGGR